MKILNIIDLSHEMFNCCAGYMPYEMAKFTYEKILPKDGYTAERINMNSHTATHFDAPYHVMADGMFIDEMPLEQFMGPAVVINLGDLEPRAAITLDDVKPYDEKISEGDIVMLCTGFAKQRGWNSNYVDDWPHLNEEAAEWLISKGVKGICTDGLSIAGNRPEKAVVHTAYPRAIMCGSLKK